jgi:HlyD family secretion protein
MMSRGLVWLAVGVIAVAALAVWISRGGDNALEVTTATASRVPSLQSLVTASGEIVASQYADIGSNAMGRVVELTVKEGDKVTGGQVLARLDPIQAAAAAEGADAALSALESDTRSAAAQVRSTEAMLDEARSRNVEAAAALERAQQLRDAGLLAAAEFDRIAATAAAARAQEASAASAVEKNELARTSSQRRVEQARAERARVRDQLSKTTITAPISGTITRLDVELGEMVVMGVQNQPGTILMTISDLSTINAEVKVAEADVMRLAVGQPAHVTLEALTGQRFAGRVIEIGASALPQAGAQSAREFRVKIELDRSDIPLLPGLTCDAEIVAADKRNILVVPLQSVAVRDGKPGVFAISGDRARFTPVTTGIIGGLQIEVEGVAEGTEIVAGSIQALRDLQDGAPIQRTPTRR